MKQINKIRSAFLGQTPIYLENNGECVEEVIIRYKDLFFSVMIDSKSGLPTGSFGWSKETPITNTPIKEFYTAERKLKG